MRSRFGMMRFGVSRRLRPERARRGNPRDSRRRGRRERAGRARRRRVHVRALVNEQFEQVGSGVAHGDQRGRREHVCLLCKLRARARRGSVADPPRIRPKSKTTLSFRLTSAAVVRVGAAFQEELAQIPRAAGDRRGQRGYAAREARAGRRARVEERARDAIRAGGGELFGGGFFERRFFAPRRRLTRAARRHLQRRAAVAVERVQGEDARLALAEAATLRVRLGSRAGLDQPRRALRVRRPGCDVRGVPACHRAEDLNRRARREERARRAGRARGDRREQSRPRGSIRVVGTRACREETLDIVSSVRHGRVAKRARRDADSIRGLLPVFRRVAARVEMRRAGV